MTHRKLANRRATRALSSAAMVTALWSANSASGVVNSFFPGATFASGAADWGTASNWSLGHVPNDATEEIVIPAGGGTQGANTMTFNGGNIVADSITHVGSLGRVLVNNSATPDVITLSGLSGKPVIWDNAPGFQLTVGTDTINQINIHLSSLNNEIRNSAFSGGNSNIVRIFANIIEDNPGTAVSFTAPMGVGTFILGGNNSISGPITFKTSNASINFTGGTTLGSGSLIVNGGSLTMVASQNNAAPTNTVLSRTTLNAGSNQFRFEGGTQTNASVLDLGTIVRQPAALANFAAVPGSGSVSIRGDVAISNGIIGGWATAQNAKNDNNYGWATVDGSRNIVQLPTASYATKNDLSTWSGNDNINIDNAAAITNSAGGVSINSLRTDAGGVYTLTFSGRTTISSGGVLIEGTTTSTVTFAGAGPITSGTNELILNPAITSATPGQRQLIISTPIVDPDANTHLNLIKTHSGTVIILGSHTYSGDVYINQGTLMVETMGNVGDASGLGTNGTIYLGGFGGPGTVNFGAGASTAIVGNNTSNRAFVFGPGGAIIRGGAGTVILNGPMSGIGQFTRFGVGGWTSIFGSKTYTGSTVVGAGTLDIDVIANSGQPSGLGTGADAATIQLGNGNASCLNYSGLVNASTDRPIALTANSQIIRVENNSTPVNLTLTGAMSGTFSWQKLGTGTLTITGSKTYSGPLTIGKGDLSIDSPGGLGTGATANSATITLGNTNTATLTFTGASGTVSRPFTLSPQAGQFGAFEATTGSLGLSGQIDTNGKALAFDGAGTISVNSAIIGAGSLTKNGHGQLNLNGTNSYTGNTTIQAGTVVFAGATAWSPALNGPGFTTINGGRAVFDYSSGGNPSALIQSSLMGSYPTFSSGQLRSTTADSRRGLGWADDGVSTVTVAYTYFGDANLDGMVNTSDFNVLAQNFNSTTGVWKTGDFNYDGNVNALDFNAVATNFGATPITPGVGLGALVPEPTSIALFAACGLALSRKREKRITQTPPSRDHPRAGRGG